MYANVIATTLKEDVMAISGPSCGKRNLNNGAPMPLAPKFRMSDDVFEESVLTPPAQQVWRCDEHASGNDPGVRGRYKDGNTFA